MEILILSPTPSSSFRGSAIGSKNPNPIDALESISNPFSGNKKEKKKKKKEKQKRTKKVVHNQGSMKCSQARTACRQATQLPTIYRTAGIIHWCFTDFDSEPCTVQGSECVIFFLFFSFRQPAPLLKLRAAGGRGREGRGIAVRTLGTSTNVVHVPFIRPRIIIKRLGRPNFLGLRACPRRT